MLKNCFLYKSNIKTWGYENSLEITNVRVNWNPRYQMLSMLEFINAKFVLGLLVNLYSHLEASISTL